MNEALWGRLQRAETALDATTADAEDAVRSEHGSMLVSRATLCI